MFGIDDRLFAEEHDRRIGVQHLGHALGVALRPGADVLHGRLIGGQLATVDQPAADGCIGLAVVVGVGDTDCLARIRPIGQLDTAGALYLQEEVVDRVVYPDHHRGLASRGLNGRPGVIGHDALAVQLAAHALAGQVRIHRAQVDRQQVGGHGVERPLVLAALAARAAHQGFVIAGDRVGGGLAVGGVQAPRLQISLQEAAHAFAVTGGRRAGRVDGGGANRLPDARRGARGRGQVTAGLPHQTLAITQEQGPELGQVVGRPARHFGPVGRLELAGQRTGRRIAQRRQRRHHQRAVGRGGSHAGRTGVA
ncbi:hypothetical protein D3C85_1060710 [compost metagenome]